MFINRWSPVVTKGKLHFGSHSYQVPKHTDSSFPNSMAVIPSYEDFCSSCPVCVCIHVHTSVCVCMCVFVCVYLCVFMYVYSCMWCDCVCEIVWVSLFSWLHLLAFQTPDGAFCRYRPPLPLASDLLGLSISSAGSPILSVAMEFPSRIVLVTETRERTIPTEPRQWSGRRALQRMSVLSLPHLSIWSPNANLMWSGARKRCRVKRSPVSSFHFWPFLWFLREFVFNILMRDPECAAVSFSLFLSFRFFLNEHLVIYSGSKL